MVLVVDQDEFVAGLRIGEADAARASSSSDKVNKWLNFSAGSP
jgi:hypothetical protein